MSLKRNLFIFVLCMAGLHSLNAQGAAVIRGQVIDVNCFPIDGAKWRLSAIEEFHDGKWKLMWYSGLAPTGVTDSNGSFVIFCKAEGRRFDVQFSKEGFAPAFIFQKSCDANEITVILKQGESIRGTVSRIVDGKREAEAMKEVLLQLPCRDFWYQERTFTDENGRYEFRVCAPPIDPSGLKRKWSVVVDDKTVEVDVQDGEPIEDVNF